MKIEVEDTKEYDTGIHPEVTEIYFKRRRYVGDFFKGDRFPNLVKLVCIWNQLTKLELNCPSLQMLFCDNNQLTELELNCPSLRVLTCSYNQLTELNLDSPALQNLVCSHNQLTKLRLNGPSLKKLACWDNKLTELELNCCSLQTLICDLNQLADLNGIEFCTELKKLICSKDLEESAEILRAHLPDLEIMLA